MSSEALISEQLRERIAVYQNPYLLLELEEAPQEGPSSDQRWAFFKKLENPPAYYDLFGDDAKPPVATPPPVSKSASSKRPVSPSLDVAITREYLQELLDEVLDLYEPHVAKPEWLQVRNFRSKFLEEASRTPDRLRQVAGGLRRLKFSLMPGEKVEYNRAPAERIINELKRLLV